MVTMQLHPAKARRIARAMPPVPPHTALLRPLDNGDARAIIATSQAQDFIETLFGDLAAADWQARLGAMRGQRRGSDGVLELSQPIHRKFQLALFEAVCPTPGTPRLDPKKIASQGIVIRRREGSRWSGWATHDKALAGWLPLVEGDADPDPRKRAAAHAGNAAVRALIARGKGAEPAEAVIPLYIAPPDVCAARGKTILFAVIPVVSNERPVGPAPGIDYNALPARDRNEMVAHLSGYLKQRAATALPRAGEQLAADWNVLDRRPGETAAQAQLRSFGIFLQQLLVECDALGPGPAAAALMLQLRELRLPTRRDSRGEVAATIDAASFVAKAAPILIGREVNGERFAMPLEWPAIGAAQGERLTQAALDCLSARHAALAQPATKYETLTDRYAVRAFIRLKGHDQCPETLIWSVYSETFRILPWWDGDGPGTKISLPDMSQLKRVKPNVAFELPPSLANLLQKDMKALSDGEGGSTDGPGIGWLCNFSIPIITLCAFIVLNIFLSLLNIVFQWMMFLKICIPIPKR